MRSGNQIGNGRRRSSERDHDHSDRPLNVALTYLTVEKHRYQRGGHRCQIQKSARRCESSQADQIRLDLIVRTDPKPNTNQPTMHAVIAPASVASICAVEELPRTGD